MCDPECAKRFQAMELKLATITTDVKWVKYMCGAVVVIVGAVFGIDLKGMV